MISHAKPGWVGARCWRRARLIRRGVAPSVAVCMLAVTSAEASPPPHRVESVIRTAAGRMPPAAVTRRPGHVLPLRGDARIVLVIMFAMAVAGGAAGLMVCPRGLVLEVRADTPSVAPRPEPVAADRPMEAPPRFDRLGDPLPPGAIARLGTQRFRNDGEVRCVTYSPDGRVLASSTGQGLQIRDAASGRELHRFDGTGIRDGMLVFSPDGKMLAYSSDVEGGTRQIMIRDVATGREIQRTAGPKGDYHELAYSPDGKLLAAILHGKDFPPSVKLYDAATFEECQGIVPSRADGASLNTVDFLPDSRTLLIVGDFSPGVQFWDVVAGNRLRGFPARAQIRGACAISRDGTILAMGFRRGERGLRGAFEIGRGSFSWALGFNREEREIRGAIPMGQDSFSWALGYSRGLEEIRLIDANTGREVRRIEVDQEPRRLAFSPDGKRLAAWCMSEERGDDKRDPATEQDDGTLAIQVWDVATGRETHRLPGHPRRIHGFWVSGPWAEGRKSNAWNNEITSLSFAPDGRTLATTGGENWIRLWDVARGTELFAETEHPSSTGSIVFTRDSQTVITGSIEGNLLFWDPRTGAERRRIRAHRSAVMGLAISADGATLLSEGQNGPAKFWDLATGQMSRQVVLPRDPGQNALEFSPDGRMILTGGPPHRLIDVKGGRERAQLPRDPEDNVRCPFCVKFVPNHHTLIASYGAYLLECNVATGRLIRRIDKSWIKPHAHGTCLTISPDGSRLATGEQDENVHEVDRITGREVARFVAPGTKGFGTIAYSPDGRLIAAGDGHSMCLWEVTSGRLLRTVDQVHGGDVDNLTFSPDGRLLASSRSDATVLIWDVVELGRSPEAVP
jgi:WD40 repeat protein